MTSMPFPLVFPGQNDSPAQRSIYILYIHECDVSMQVLGQIRQITCALKAQCYGQTNLQTEKR